MVGDLPAQPLLRHLTQQRGERGGGGGDGMIPVVAAPGLLSWRCRRLFPRVFGGVVPA
jgi:hypothetical protein